MCVFWVTVARNIAITCSFSSHNVYTKIYDALSLLRCGVWSSIVRYCNAGGGGERVLWCAVNAVLGKYDNVCNVIREQSELIAILLSRIGGQPT